MWWWRRRGRGRPARAGGRDHGRGRPPDRPAAAPAFASPIVAVTPAASLLPLSPPVIVMNATDPAFLDSLLKEGDDEVDLAQVLFLALKLILVPKI